MNEQPARAPFLRRVKGALSYHLRHGAAQARLLPENFRRARRQRIPLVILDDCFPHLLTSFRIAEYNAYLERFPTAEVHSDGRSFRALQEKRPFAEVLADYSVEHGTYSSRILRYSDHRRLAAKACYTVFLQNAFLFLPTIEQERTPFAFTLYPGGGFRLHDAASDERLRRVCGSPLLRKIVVTQPITRDYLVNEGFCPPDKLVEVFGVVVPTERLMRAAATRPRAPKRPGETVDLCFVAHKYMPQGRDKGYDRFIEVVRLLVRRNRAVHAHVVGPFEASDIPVDDIADRITFYGPRPTEFFLDFYARMDAIVSPNVPFVIAPGAFDGFPTGACVEAALCGVPVFCTDELAQNQGIFRNGDEIEITSRDPDEICARLESYLDQPERLAALGARGRGVFGRVYATETQMQPRLRMLTELVGDAAR